VLTGGAGGRAMMRAFSELFQITAFQDVPMAGRTDRWIIRELAGRHGVEVDDQALTHICRRYLQHLSQEVHATGPSKGVLPGVTSLLDALSSRDDVHLALLTGNVEAGARIKLEHFDLWRYFDGGGFGDTAEERTALFADALRSVTARAGTAFQAEQVTIVGDTPLDVAVATACGARSLGVATGSFDEQALREAGADAVLPDLSDLDAALEALGLTERS
jgi:phosphoglycolate phosphatase